MNKNFKSGFSAIIGMPNVGKSTLLNAIAGQKIAIISDKPQTTRNKILAIYQADDAQIIFTDTPGIHNPHNKLGEFMVRAANESMRDTDVVIFVVDASKGIRSKEREIAENIGKLGIPAVLVINKIDLVKKEDLLPLIADFASMNDFADIIPISAKDSDGVSSLISIIKDHLESGPMFYDEDAVTDQPEKQIAAEIIREKMLWLLEEEVPHGIAIEIT
ncbi:MAG: GTPase Era, partial [Oscillospiraceae bacterium]|nr:GTPase Era [Oscillospiraceae bacterium]